MDTTGPQDLATLTAMLAVRDQRILELEGRVAELEAAVAALKRKLTGVAEMAFKRSERARIPGVEAATLDPKAPCAGAAASSSSGGRGHGRRSYDHLPTREVVHLPPGGRPACNRCGAPYTEVGVDHTAQEIHVRVVVERVIDRRPRFVRSCACSSDVALQPAVIAAPPVPKVIAGGLLAAPSLAFLLVQKYAFGMPLLRIVRMLAQEGLDLAPSSLVGMLHALLPLFLPLYEALRQHLGATYIRHMDETRWLVFGEPGTSHRHWLWVAQGEDVTVYAVDPHRSTAAMQNLLPQHPVEPGYVVCDMYAAYFALDQTAIRRAHCWAHVRRFFVRAARTDHTLRRWSVDWLVRIRTLFRLRRAWAREPGDAAARALLEHHVLGLRRTLTRQFNAPLHDEADRVLTTVDKHWLELTRFLEDPRIPLDNNAAERALRTPVVGRKNYYGSRAVWAGQFAATMFTILGTATQNGLNARAYLTAYLEACARCSADAPVDLERFLPWALRDEDRLAWAIPTRATPDPREQQRRAG